MATTGTGTDVRRERQHSVAAASDWAGHQSGDRMSVVLKSDALKDERTVGTTKAKRILHGVIDAHRSGQIGAIIQITFGIGRLKVNCGRRHLVMNGQDREDRLDTTGATEQVSRHRLGGVHHE